MTGVGFERTIPVLERAKTGDYTLQIIDTFSVVSLLHSPLAILGQRLLTQEVLKQQFKLSLNTKTSYNKTKSLKKTVTDTWVTELGGATAK
jgi:hypothetical protein